MGFFDMVIIAGLIILVIYFFREKKSGSKANRKNVQGPLSQESGNAYGGWWENYNSTPLSASEMQTIAEKVDAFYTEWICDRTISHTQIVIWLETDAVKYVCSRRDMERKIPYTHAISCQADRELLANCILRRIRQQHLSDGVAVQLYLDGDAIILPTN